MKVLLTGASGFIGGRILARLAAEGIPAVVLLRSPGARDRLRQGAAHAEIRWGTLADRPSLEAALEGVSHVIHCAGKTKALRASEFAEVNTEGTRSLVQAMATAGNLGRRLVHLSSLAACGPAVAHAPAREDDPPRPISAYGQSKLAAEQLIRAQAGLDAVILRPGGVYGPGDQDFLHLFRIAKRGWCPVFAGGRQPLNLVYAEDLAAVAIRCLEADTVPGGLYHVGHPRVVTARELAETVAAVMDRPARMVRLPQALLVLLSWGGELLGRLRGIPGILGVDRRRELMAPGWVCDSTRLRERAGLECPTDLREGLKCTLEWYRATGWL